MSYSPLTESDIKSMLKELDISSVNDLFNIVPEKFKIDYEKFNIVAPGVIRTPDIYFKNLASNFLHFIFWRLKKLDCD